MVIQIDLPLNYNWQIIYTYYFVFLYRCIQWNLYIMQALYKDVPTLTPSCWYPCQIVWLAELGTTNRRLKSVLSSYVCSTVVTINRYVVCGSQFSPRLSVLNYYLKVAFLFNVVSASCWNNDKKLKTGRHNVATTVLKWLLNVIFLYLTVVVYSTWIFAVIYIFKTTSNVLFVEPI